MKHARVCAAAIVGATMFAASAKANVIYDFVGTAVTGPAASLYGPLSLEMVVDDATAHGGQLSFAWQQCGGPRDTFCVHTGTSQGLLGFVDRSGRGGSIIEPTFGTGTVFVGFNQDTSIASASINESAESWGVKFSAIPEDDGSTRWTMAYGADAYPQCSGVSSFSTCTVSGFVTVTADPTDAPEPGTLAVLGVGLLGLAGVLRHPERVPKP